MKEQRLTYTEKDTIKKMENFQADLSREINEGEEISNLKYYTNLKFSQMIEVSGDFFIVQISTTEKKQKNIIYAKNSKNIIGYIDEKGNLEFVDKLLRDLDISLTLEDLETINIENLQAKAEALDLKELEEYLRNINRTEEEQDNADSIERDDERDDGKKEKENDEKQIEQALYDEMGENLEISYYREIKDKQMEREFPDQFLGAESIGLAYAKSINRFIMVKKEKGQFKRIEDFEPAQPTMRTVIGINEDGSKIERKNPHALIKTGNTNKELSVTIGQYGYIETGIVDRLPCNERVEHQVREEGQTREGGKTAVAMRYDINNGGKEEIHDWAHNFSDNEDMGIETQNLEAIDGNKEFKLKDGTITTFNQEAAKAKVSVDEFIKTFINAEGSTFDEKLENTHLEFEQQVGARGFERYERR